MCRKKRNSSNAAKIKGDKNAGNTPARRKKNEPSGKALAYVFIAVALPVVAVAIEKRYNIFKRISTRILQGGKVEGSPEAIQEKDLKENGNIGADVVSTQELEELYQLAYENNLAFMQKFKLYYPVFFKSVTANYPNWLASELEACALLKLNFSTKEIAQITNSSIRSVESKKYRIRKKMSIPSHENISVWLNMQFP